MTPADIERLRAEALRESESIERPLAAARLEVRE